MQLAVLLLLQCVNLSKPSRRAPMTISEVEAIEARAEAATPGPWAWEQYGEKVNAFSVGVACDEDGNLINGRISEGDIIADTIIYRSEIGSHEAAVVNYGDPDFIAHARTDVPALCATAKAAIKDRDELVKALEEVLRGEHDSYYGKHRALLARIREETP